MRTPLSSLLFITVILVSNVFASASLSITNSGVVSGPLLGKWFDYVVVIMMENHSINLTYYKGVGTNTCLGNCTYFSSLANSNGLAKEYTDDSIQAGSLGDYVAITSGYGTLDSGCNSSPPGSSGCPFLQIPNIIDRLESAGLSWKAYMEGYPVSSGCYNNDMDFPNYYHFSHDPFTSYADIQNSTSRCSHIVNANSKNPQPKTPLPRCWPIAVDNDDLFLKDLNSVVDASNYMFLTPDTIDDNHDCNDVSVGNAWLNQLVPQILRSTLFTSRKAALFITFDEDGCTFSGCPSAGPELYTVWASNPTNPTTVAGLKSIQHYTHYSSLRTIEDNWNLPPLIASTDGSASNMHEFLIPR